MESQPKNPEFRINPENFTHAIKTYRLHITFCGGGLGLGPGPSPFLNGFILKRKKKNKKTFIKFSFAF